MFQNERYYLWLLTSAAGPAVNKKIRPDNLESDYNEVCLKMLSEAISIAQ